MIFSKIPQFPFYAEYSGAYYSLCGYVVKMTEQSTSFGDHMIAHGIVVEVLHGTEQKVGDVNARWDLKNFSVLPGYVPNER